MTLEIILGAIGLALAAIAGAFGIGHSRGISTAEAAAEKQRVEDKAAAVSVVAERRVEATKGAADVQQTVNHMPIDDVDRELRENFRRPGGN
ncbi:hypothetical protein [Dryocola sp. BD626]|uniref:hypothetical protein n=1 Tax=Dryocola sp. BD626 TaxID=3133273 RepID=UPI003F50615F